MDNQIRDGILQRLRAAWIEQYTMQHSQRVVAYEIAVARVRQCRQAALAAVRSAFDTARTEVVTPADAPPFAPMAQVLQSAEALVRELATGAMADDGGAATALNDDIACWRGELDALLEEERSRAHAAWVARHTTIHAAFTDADTHARAVHQQRDTGLWWRMGSSDGGDAVDDTAPVAHMRAAIAELETLQADVQAMCGVGSRSNGVADTDGIGVDSRDPEDSEDSAGGVDVENPVAIAALKKTCAMWHARVEEAVCPRVVNLPGYNYTLGPGTWVCRYGPGCSATVCLPRAPRSITSMPCLASVLHALVGPTTHPQLVLLALCLSMWCGRRIALVAGWRGGVVHWCKCWHCAPVRGVGVDRDGLIGGVGSIAS